MTVRAELRREALSDGASRTFVNSLTEALPLPRRHPLRLLRT